MCERMGMEPNRCVNYTAEQYANNRSTLPFVWDVSMMSGLCNWLNNNWRQTEYSLITARKHAQIVILCQMLARKHTHSC